MATIEQKLYISEILGPNKTWKRPVEQLVRTGAWDAVIEVAKEVKEGKFNNGVPVAAEVFLHTTYHEGIPVVVHTIRYNYTGKEPYAVGSMIRYEAESRGVGIQAGAPNPIVCYTDTEGWKYLNLEGSYTQQLEQAFRDKVAKLYTDPRHGPDLWVEIGTRQRALVPTNPRVISIPFNPLQR